MVTSTVRLGGHQSVSWRGLVNVANLSQCASSVPALSEWESVEIWLRPLRNAVM